MIQAYARQFSDLLVTYSGRFLKEVCAIVEDVGMVQLGKLEDGRLVHKLVECYGRIVPRVAP